MTYGSPADELASYRGAVAGRAPLRGVRAMVEIAGVSIRTVSAAGAIVGCPAHAVDEGSRSFDARGEANGARIVGIAQDLPAGGAAGGPSVSYRARREHRGDLREVDRLLRRHRVGSSRRSGEVRGVRAVGAA
jgi:hypothetical protein